ncbi:AsmA family protein [Afifella marina]|uniref:AsmA family protein n=1 Tax=Afifella marina TaxID=1080 RepID=UPI00244EA176|nr:AsmA family protein [Afifella marina]
MGLAIIAVLFTALIGPYLVDWSAYRQEFEEKASASLGVPVKVRGDADLSILPTPSLRLADVRIGPSDAPILMLGRLRAKVELTGLLKGEINIISVQLDRPRLMLDVADLAQPGRRLRIGRFGPEQISLDEMDIRNGEIDLKDSRRGASWRIGDINALMQARSLEGPGHLQGGFRLGGDVYSIDVGVGRLADGRMPLKASLTPAAKPLVLSVAGDLVTDGEDGLGLKGTFDLSGLTPDTEAVPAQPQSLLALLRTKGEFELTSEKLASEDFTFAYGPEANAVQAAGHGELAFVPEPRFAIALDARQIDLDRALGGGAGKPVAIEKAAERLVAGLTELPRPAVPGTLTLDAQGVVVGGSVIQAVGTDVKPTENGWRVDVLSAMLPGATRIDVSGDIDTATPTFHGHGRIASERPAAFAAWWRGDAGDALRLDRFKVEADLDLSQRRQTAQNLVAEINDGTIDGAISMRRFARTGETFADVTLSAENVALEEAQIVTGLLAGDDLRNGNFARVAMSLAAQNLSVGGAEAASVNLEGVLTGDSLDIATLSIADLAGADINVSGRIENFFAAPRGRLSADIVAENLSGAAAFLRGLLPQSQLAERLVARADALSPVDASLVATAETDGAQTLELSGNFAGTRLTLTADGRGGFNDPEELSGQADLLVQSQDSASLLAQLGFDVVPLPGSGPARVSLKMNGAAGEGADLEARGRVAGIDFGFDGRGEFDGDTPSLAGPLTLSADDVDPALLLAGVALPGIGEGHALAARGPLKLAAGTAELDLERASFDDQNVGGTLTAHAGGGLAIGGDLRLQTVSLPFLLAAPFGVTPTYVQGAWPTQAFAPALPGGISLDLAVKAQEAATGLAMPLRNPAFTLRYDGGRLRLDHLSGGFAGGALSGVLSAGGGEGVQPLTLQLSLKDAVLAELVWREDGRPVAAGRLSSSLELMGHGRSFSGMVSALNGSGSFTLRDGLLRYLNPQAFGSVIRAADAGLKLESEPVAAAFSGHLDAGTLSFDEATGSFSVTSGTVRLSTLQVAGSESATVLGNASIYLNRMELSSDWSLKVDPGQDAVTGAQPEVGIVFSGPLADPGRHIDITPFLGFLTVRAFEQEVERVEKLQAEILEGERLRRELKRQREAEQRQEREKAAQAAAEKAAAEKAAAEKAAAEEAARQAEEATEDAAPNAQDDAQDAGNEQDAGRPGAASGRDAPLGPDAPLGNGPQDRPEKPEARGSTPQPQGSEKDQETFGRRLGRILDEPVPQAPTVITPGRGSSGTPLNLLPSLSE